jgi:hypothetical protein
MLKIKGRKDLEIYFNNGNPERFLGDVSLFGLNKDETKEALKKPFIVNHKFEVLIEYQGKQYYFVIPKGYTWNGANVPVFAWWIIGSRTEPRFMLASCIHDYICEHHEVIGNDRYLSTLIFETLCLYFGKFNDIKRWAMFHSIDNFQKFCGWN